MKKGKFVFLKRGIILLFSAVVFGAVAGVTFNFVADADGNGGSVFGYLENIFDDDSRDNADIGSEADIDKDSATDKVGGTQSSDKKEDGFAIPTTSLLEDRDADVMDVSDIAYNAMPSVVSINVTATVQESFWYYGNYEYESEGSGSGIIIGKNDTELLIVTNNHVVEDADTVNVCFIDGESYEAAVKGTDSDNDLAVVAIPLNDISKETLSEIKIARLGDSEEVLVGEQVVAIGNALGYGQSVTTGIVSAKDRIVSTNTTPLIQTDAAINPGNSGGALLNMKGEVIGINSSKYMSTEVEGMGYAIPVSKVENILDDLMNRKTRELVENEEKRGYLGISCSTYGSETSDYYDIFGEMQEFKNDDEIVGVYVNEVTKGSPAYKAGLRAKSIITRFDGQSVKTAGDLTDLLKYYEAGERVELDILVPDGDGYEEKTIKVRLGSRTEITEQ